MNAPSMNWSPGVRRLLFIGVSVVTAGALSYDYAVTEGILDAFLVIIGASVLLATLVIMSVRLSDRTSESD